MSKGIRISLELCNFDPSKGVFPMPFHLTSIGIPVKAVSKEVWEAFNLKPRTSYSTGTRGAKELLSRLLWKPAALGAVCAC